MVKGAILVVLLLILEKQYIIHHIELLFCIYFA